MEATLSTQEADAWSEDPATPAVRCIRRTLVSVGDAVRDVRVLLALCVERPCEGVRSPAAAICLDEAVVAVGALVDAATHAVAALDRALNATW
jgi:hypothetical protein